MSLLRRTRTLYLERGSAVVEVDRVALFFRDGELFLDRADLRVANVLRAFDDKGASGQRLRHQVAAFARQLAGHRSRQRDTKPRGAVDLAGPLPTVELLMELAVHGCGERELLNRVGGPQATFRTDTAGPAMANMAELEPEMTQVLATLTEPMPAQAIIRSVTLDRFGALQGLARLWAVGLVVHHEEDDVEEAPVNTVPVEAPKVRPRILERLNASVAESLATQPLKLSPAEHREKVAGLWQKHGGLDHYALLDLARDVSAEALHKSFAHLARQVHPVHAERLDLAGKDEMLQVLFERAVEAYWALSDTTRRLAYNRSLGAATMPIDDRQRGEEKREMARNCYHQGSQLLAANDVSMAVDVLREAVRMDARADYLSLLGLAQVRNPAWIPRAIESFEHALRLDPGHVRARMGLAAAYESNEQVSNAVEHYRAVLVSMPDHAEARVALERLGAGAPAARTSGRLRGLLGRD